MRHGYIRIWPTGPTEADQRASLARVGVEPRRTHVDDGSRGGRRASAAGRPTMSAREQAINAVRRGDVLVVACPAILGNSVADLMEVMGRIADKEARVFDAEAGNEVTGIAAAAEFAARAKRQLSRMRTVPASIAIVERGIRTGPARRSLRKTEAELMLMWKRPDLYDVRFIAKQAGCSVRTLYNRFAGIPRWMPAGTNHVEDRRGRGDADRPRAERQRLLRLAKSKGLDLSPPTVTAQQILQAATTASAGELVVTDATTDAELSVVVRGAAGTLPPESTQPSADREAFRAFRPVRLRTSQTSGEVTFPAGARGVVVDVYPDGNYGVEFSVPTEDVVIVRGKDLDAA